MFRDVRARSDFATAVQSLVQALLSSPFFLYQVEFDPPGTQGGERVPVTDQEMATRLAYLIWASTPDDALVDKGERGELHTAQEIEAAARRMLADDKAQRGLRRYYATWLSLADVDDVKIAPVAELGGETSAFVTDLQQSLNDFIDFALSEPGFRFSDLMSSNALFANERMSRVYGLGVTNTAFERVNDTRRSGLLSQPAILTLLSKMGSTDPVRRGAYVRRRFLCRELPPPPPDVDTTLPPPVGDQTTTDVFRAHSQPECQACHRLIDGIGFGMEDYDRVGRFNAAADTPLRRHRGCGRRHGSV